MVLQGSVSDVFMGSRLQAGGLSYQSVCWGDGGGGEGRTRGGCDVGCRAVARVLLVERGVVDVVWWQDGCAAEEVLTGGCGSGGGVCGGCRW